MSKRIKRNEDGQFAAGQSGNPEGARLRKPRQLLTLEDLYRIQLEVAGETAGTIGGKLITRHENAVRNLASGNSGKRLASKDFIEENRSAAYFFERKKKQEALRRSHPGAGSGA